MSINKKGMPFDSVPPSANNLLYGTETKEEIEKKNRKYKEKNLNEVVDKDK